MQLSKVSLNKPSVMEFKDPYTNESFEKPIFVTVHASKSKVGKEAEHGMRVAIMTAMQDENNIVIDGESKNLKPELIRIISFNMLSELIESWKGVEDENGKAIKFTKDNAIQAFSDCEEFADSIYAYVSSVANFPRG